ncbi:MAG: cyclic nucleotide-binding domain-containing protein [Bacteroides sp.]|nr:cyclic nucleotide-binding domain-containing protein [Prevotella sp.]MCM1407143.1 cyclic nucleotide-binding domain-containing protein [Treponema brennaborense]MCM1470295.1 cyclic nucleotide-binding domain-containing protein [Bacteroides sp.]
MLQLSFANFKKDACLLVEGNSDNSRFFILQKGHVRCFREFSVGEGQSGVLGPGDFLGVIPCMSGHNQLETVVALTDVVVISVAREQYPELIKKNIPVALKVIKTFANKMRNFNETLTKLTLKNSIVSSPEQLFAIASYYEKNGKISLAVYGYYQYMKACPHGMYIEQAKVRFLALRPHSHAVYFEDSPDQIRTYPKDTMIFSECQSGQDLFIIQEGQVKISKVVDGNEVILAVLKKGDFFGEMALLENKPRSASAIAHEDCQLLVVNRRNFDQMVSTQPQLIARLTTTLAERLWAMSRQLENTRLSDPLFKLFDMLELQLEKSKVNIQPGMPYQFDLTPADLANMCGIPKEEQSACIAKFIGDSRIKITDDKIFVPDCYELTKSAGLYRKK